MHAIHCRYADVKGQRLFYRHRCLGTTSAPQGKAGYFAKISARNPVRRIGTVQDIAQGVLFALTNTFLTGRLCTSTAASRSPDPIRVPGPAQARQKGEQQWV